MSSVQQERISDAFRSASEASLDPAMAAANWLARDIDPSRTSVVELLIDPTAPIEQLRKAKDAFKTMRIVGETAADRHLAAQLYAGTIGAALVYHNRRISRQSTRAMRRGLTWLQEDMDIPEPLRTLAGTALCALNGPPWVIKSPGT